MLEHNIGRIYIIENDVNNRGLNLNQLLNQY